MRVNDNISSSEKNIWNQTVFVIPRKLGIIITIFSIILLILFTAIYSNDYLIVPWFNMGAFLFFLGLLFVSFITILIMKILVVLLKVIFNFFKVVFGKVNTEITLTLKFK